MKKVHKLLSKILPKNKLIIEFLEGDISLKDLKELKNTLVEKKDYDASFNFIVDFRKANLLISTEDIDSYIYFIENHKKVLAKRESAILTSTPQHVVLTTLYKIKAKHLPVEWEIFSTVEKSLSWTRQTILSPDECEKIIQSMQE